MLLAIDTSAGTGVAIVDDDERVLAERTTTDTRRHAEVIGDHLSGCLVDAALTPADVTAVAVGMGPGPFTGLRVGIAAARAFAFGCDVPLMPVVSHDALAFARYREGASGPLLVVTDARRREVYRTRYTGVDAAGLPVREAGPSIASAARDEHGRLDVVHASGEREACEIARGPVAPAALALLARGLRRAGRLSGPDEPLYLRSPDVTVSAGPRRVTA